MWTTMGYSDGGEFNIPDSFNGRKFRPLVPRPKNNSASGSSPPCLGRLHGTDFFALNHQLANMADPGKREFNTQPAVVVSSRWNPTPEQLRTLEELYRRGTRTPSADQIQHITAQLRRYGKIEGKNVFYWFQNHKARERQKRRRQMESSGPPLDDDDDHQQQQQQKESSGASRTLCYEEDEQINNWASSTNCTTLSDQESVSLIPRAASKAGVTDQCRSPDGWIQFDEAGELLLLHQQQQRSRNFMERNARWQQMMQLSCPSPTTQIINTSSISTTATTTRAIATTTTTTTQAAVELGSMDPRTKLINKAPHDLNNIFIAPFYGENWHHHGGALINHVINEDHDGGESPTLQLFPLRTGADDGNIGSINEKETTEVSVATPCQFFEFLPLKN